MRRFERAAPFSAGVVILLLSIPCVAQSGASAAHGAQLFVDKCSACHSVGGGDLAGPDLIRATQMSHSDVRAAVHKMEDNVGALTVDDVEALVALLKNGQVKQLIAAAQNPPIPAKVEAVARGSSRTGGRLFYGDARFKNGGSPCFACHSAGGRGGNLAIDLTLVRTRMNQSALVATTQQPGFPLMKAAYAKHVITEQEAFDLAAFLKEPGAAAKPGAPPRERAGVVYGAGAGAAVAVLAGVGLIRTRRAGIRSRRVRERDSSGGE